MSTNRKLEIPMSAPDLTDDERNAVMGVLQTNRLSMGPQTTAFEAAAASLVGVTHGVAVSSGTAGLHLCIRAAGVQDTDWVITTPFSFVATGNVMLYERAVPIFVDVDPVSGNLDAGLAKKAAADLVKGGSVAEGWLPRKGVHGDGKLKAIIPVDVFGQPANYDVMQEITETHNLALIEDSCEAIGAEFNGQKAGSFGDAGIFAFYPNKQITTGEGGVIVTDRDDWAEKIRALRNQGRTPGDTWLDHTYLGYNYRMDEMSAAMGEVQLGRLDELLEKRAIVASLYTENLKGMTGVETPVLLPSTSRMSWFVYVIRLDQEIDRAQVIQQLGEHGVPSRPYFSPIHLQPFYREQFGYREGDFPIAEDLGKRSLSIPFSGVMTQNQVEYVCGTLRDVLTNI